jgi:glutamine synthetase
MRYQTELAKNAKVLESLGIENSDKILKEVSELIIRLDSAVRELQTQIDIDPVDEKDHANAIKNPGLSANIQIAEAEHCLHKIVPAMGALRSIVDTLEIMVAEDLWPFPSYQHMLFVK